MRRRRPDLLRVLLDPIETDRRGEVPEGSNRISTFLSSIITTAWSQRSISGNTSSRHDDFMVSHHLVQLQIEALDLFDELANDPKLNLMMELQPGDIQLVHNHTILA